MWKVCPVCGKKFYKRTHGGRYIPKNCSRECANKNRPSMPLYQRKALLKANIGNKYNLGRKLSLATRLKMSLAFKGRKPTKGMLGKKHSEEAKEKNRLAHNGKLRGETSPHWKGGLPKCPDCGIQLKTYISKRCKDCSFKNRRGEKNPNWKGGLSSEYNKVKSSAKYNKWRLAVYRRDGFKCTWCGNNESGNLNADHIKPRFIFPELTFDVENGRTLCVDCHKKTDTFGSKIYTYAKSI